jgi:hypothetical protein
MAGSVQGWVQIAASPGLGKTRAVLAAPDLQAEVPEVARRFGKGATCGFCADRRARLAAGLGRAKLSFLIKALS